MALVDQVLPVLAMMADAQSEEEDPGDTWLEAKTADVLPIHASHRLSHRGVYTWCRACGAFTRGTYYKKLRLPCTRPTAGGKQALARIKAGQPPLQMGTGNLVAADWDGALVPQAARPKR